MSTIKPSRWHIVENDELAALYFAMWDKALAGEKYNKAAMIRCARGETKTHTVCGYTRRATLADRSKQSIEFKLMNASAAHAAIDPDAETMHNYGYRAMPNYQAALKDAMRRIIELREINTSEISATGGHYAG